LRQLWRAEGTGAWASGTRRLADNGGAIRARRTIGVDRPVKRNRAGSRPRAVGGTRPPFGRRKVSGGPPAGSSRWWCGGSLPGR